MNSFLDNTFSSEKNYHGNFCFCCTFGEISKINKDYFLEEMIHNSVLVCAEEPSDAQCRAWINCLKVLSKTIKILPESYKNTWLVFEYVLPRHKPGTKKFISENGIRPDVLVIGRNFVSVLEFKQRKLDRNNSVYAGYISQAQKYVTRLNKYHALSQEMFVSPIVVLTLEKDYLNDLGESVVCSGNKLADALILLNGTSPECMTHDEIDSWLRDSIN